MKAGKGSKQVLLKNHSFEGFLWGYQQNDNYEKSDIIQS